MACDWEKFFNTEKQSLSSFVEFVVYGAPIIFTEEFQSHIDALIKNTETIGKLVPRDLYLRELTLHTLFCEEFFEIEKKTLNALNTCNAFLRKYDKKQKYNHSSKPTPTTQSLGIPSSKELEVMRAKIKALAMDNFPAPVRRERLLYIQGFRPIYTPRELGRFLLKLHNENKFTAPQSFLDYIESFSQSPQPQSQAVVPSVSAEAQLSPPPLTTPQNDVEQDDAPLCSKERIRYLKFIYGLLEISGLPTKLDSSTQRDPTAGKIQRALGEKSVSLDPKSIKKTLGEIDENFERITKG